ncbi:MAG: helicase-related protein, partial [Methanomassiliicoccales archaeon]
LRSNTLVVLPTGMGKTVIALIVLANVLHKCKGKVLFLAPTKPLVEQHATFLREMIVGRSVTVLTGEVDPEEREALWVQNDIIVSTPQVVANDLQHERVSLKDVQLIVFDEAHRAVGSYAYVAVAQRYKDYCRLVLGMTASPGGSKTKIKEVCESLGIVDIEVRTEFDPDVAPYVQDVQMQHIEVEVPVDLRKIIAILSSLYDTYIKELTNLGVLERGRPVNMRYLLDVQNNLQARLRSGEKNKTIYRALSLQAMAVKVEHALGLAETQGTSSLNAYFERLVVEANSDEGSKASKVVVSSEQFKDVLEMMKTIRSEHPKLSKVMSIVSQQLNDKPNSRVLVFTHYRDTCDLMANKLASIPGVKVAKLVGQADRVGERGLKQKDQVGVLDKFRNGDYNVVVATSVGEEGLDVAQTDLVVFYEPVASEIRSIQRRGRTGRKRAGRVVILITKDTRDQAYYYASIKKESAMRNRLRSLSDELKEERAECKNDGPCSDKKPTKPGQASLFDF